MKTFNKCKICEKKITGVEKWDDGCVYCFKCFKSIEKERQSKKEQEKKNWYKPGMTEGEYHQKIFDLFC